MDGPTGEDQYLVESYVVFLFKSGWEFPARIFYIFAPCKILIPMRLIPMNLSAHMRRIALFVAVAMLSAVAAFGQVHTSDTYRYLLTREGAMDHLEYLTSEEVAGRESGTSQAMRTAEYIAACMESYGVRPFRSVSFFQPFTLPAGKGGSSRYTAGTGVKIEKKGHNVVGYLPSGRKNAPYVIVGAHFDHLGIIDGKVYPGADDNASGVTALLELARMFGKRHQERGDLEANIVFVAFDGNNFSLQGSKHFVSRLGIPPGNITCMVNMDQIGSTLSPVGKSPEYLLVLGGNKLKGWQKGQLDFSNEYFGLGLELDYSYYGSQDFYDIFYRLSDQQSFTAVGVPALLFTSGITKHTNKESDSVDNLDVDVLVKRIDLIYRFIWLIL